MERRYLIRLSGERKWKRLSLPILTRRVEGIGKGESMSAWVNDAASNQGLSLYTLMLADVVYYVNDKSFLKNHNFTSITVEVMDMIVFTKGGYDQFEEYKPEKEETQ